MKILHVVHSLVPGEYRGGISKVAHELAAAQVRLGHDVDVFTTTHNSGVPTDIPPGTQVTFDGIRCRYFDATPSRSASPSMQQAIQQSAASNKYDVVHGHNPFTHLSLYVGAAARQHGAVAFHHLHGALNPYGQRTWTAYLKRRVYIAAWERPNLRAARGLFCLSEHEARHAERQIGGQNTMLLPNGTTLFGAREHANAERFRKQFQIQDRQVLLFMGRIVDLKGVHLLAEAFGRLATKFPQLQLVIAGNRDQFPDYCARVDALLAASGHNHRVTWTGFLNDQQKCDALAAADLFCHPSETEGMPMAVLEAMAMELPCVIGEGCFMHEAVAAGAVLECQFNTDSVEQQLARMLESAGLRRRVAMEAVVHARQHHAWDRIAERCLLAYNGGISSSTASYKAA